MGKLILILEDQLSETISSLRDLETDDTVVLMEILSQTNKVPHHRRKLAFIFSAMRHFSLLLDKKCCVHYLKIDDAANKHDFIDNLQQLLNNTTYDELLLTESLEYGLQLYFNKRLKELAIPSRVLEDDRFLVSKKEFRTHAAEAKTLKMENFYREVRKKTGYLMENGKPTGGKWNYDQENRSKYDGVTKIPLRPNFKPDKITVEVLTAVNDQFPDRFGSLDNFGEAVTRQQALECLEFFATKCLPHFGRFQDAMIAGESFGFHSRLSHLINCGLLLPTEVCERVLDEKNKAPLAAVEGFIRQVIGWREYIRGVYMLKMPDYINSNFFNAEKPLPDFFWTANCKMNCLKSVVESTRSHAYSHHIQRLMITGNFALLAGISPVEVHEWYLAVYDDAYEWVELPNTLGMALYADGGEMSTKPYCASGNYINKMSDFCKGCSYSVTKKLGKEACPFNYLYWYFLNKNRALLEQNRRLWMPYKNLDKKSETELAAIRESAESFLQSI